MNLLNQFVAAKTNFSLSDNQINCIQMIDKGASLEEVLLSVRQTNLNIPYWQIDLFESVIRDFKDFDKKKQKYVSDVLHQNIENKEEVVTSLNSTLSSSELEDAYRPFKRRKKTKATLAREAGLAELADWILDIAYGKQYSDISLEVKAKEYIKPALGFVTYDTVLKGAQDIIVDRLLKKSEIRQKLSQLYYKDAFLKVEKSDKFKNSKYNTLLAFKEKVSALLESKNYFKFPLVKKAWEESQVKVLLEVDKSGVVESLRSETLMLSKNSPWSGFVNEAFFKAIDIHIIPSITQEIMEELLIVSENETIKRLKQDYLKILLTPAFGEKPVLSFTQVKEDKFEMALITEVGELVSATTVKLDQESSKADFSKLVEGIANQIQLGAIAIGLSPLARTTEKFILSAFNDDPKKLPAPIAFVDMRGVSSYVHKCFEADKSKSRMEYTLLTVARRMQDPLMELAKYSGKSLLDIPPYVSNEKLLPELDKVLRFCLSAVGLDINKAERIHLGLVPGVSVEAQDAILKFRTEKSRFVEKSQLRTDLGMSEEEYDLCSSFLKVPISKSILDKTQLSGKDFPAIKDFLKDQQMSLPLDMTSEKEVEVMGSKWSSIFGQEKLKFILKELRNPYSDPRRAYKFFGFSNTLKKLEDIKIGWNYPGLVTKFSSFGAFVDIGVGQEGLVHLSELSSEYVSDPRKVLGVGEWIYVHVVDVKADKKLISLSKIKAEKRPSRKVTNRTDDAKTKKNSFSKTARFDESKNSKTNYKNKNYKGKLTSGSKPNSSGANKKRAPRTPFNNPFAALSDINLKE